MGDFATVFDRCQALPDWQRSLRACEVRTAVSEEAGS